MTTRKTINILTIPATVTSMAVVAASTSAVIHTAAPSDRLSAVVRVVAVILLLIGMGSCSEQQVPVNLMPEVMVEEATAVTRNSATLQGRVNSNGSEVTELIFRYGTSLQTLEGRMEVNPAGGLQPTVSLVNLQAATTYYYTLTAGNGTSSVESSPKQFTTESNVQPTITGLKMLSQGPLSITMQFEVSDDGGLPLTAVGFYLQRTDGEEGSSAAHTFDNEELCIPITPALGTTFSRRISGLQARISYTLQPFAANEVGETRGERYPFITDDVVRLTEAGTLPEVVGETEISYFTTLTLAGPVNGTDMQLLRKIMGVAPYGEATEGRLQELDMTEVTICSGGTHYDGQHFTDDNIIGTGLFANVPYLLTLRLPDSVVEIQRNAFIGATLLTSLEVPVGVERIAPSVDCPNLRRLTVKGGNRMFSSYGDALYDSGQRVLYWYPEGKSGEVELSPTLETVAMYAFQNSRMERISLPATLTKLEEGAFYHSSLKELVIPDKVTTVPVSLCQSCSQLSSVTLGQGVALVENYSFDGTPLCDLYIRSNDFPPVCYEHSFTEEHYKSCTLHVPASLLTIYRNSTYWGRFEHIVGW